MSKRIVWFIVTLALCAPRSLFCANPALLTERWKARWIGVAEQSGFDYGVYHFRRSFRLASKPDSFLIHVTADNRYQLYVNGERVVWGPARGDLFHWRYETVDLAPHLKAGENLLAAVVWNDGEQAAAAQISNRSAFLLQGDTEREEAVNTDKRWRVAVNPAYQPLPVSFQQVNGYYAAPPGERVDGSAYPWGWEQPGYDDAGWQAAAEFSNGSPRDSVDAPNRWMLVPRPIPLMEEKPERLARVRKALGAEPPEGWLAGRAPLRIPAGREVTLWLDQNYLTTAYPELIVSGGNGARISMRYAEALWIAGTHQKGHRDEVEGKEFKGVEDVFLPDGGERRMYRPLFWRTYRYVELKIKTAGEPLTLEDVRGTYTGYPFERKAKFDSDSPELKSILDVGWRTARLCAHESYMDCPYYEHLQYVGDTRIQALVSVYNAGDARLMRNAIEQINSSRTPEGLTYSRAPSELQQYIPPFSLWWIGMVHDYWTYVADAEFVRQMLPGVRAVLSFFERHQKPGGSLARLPWWNYVDWVEGWPRGGPPHTEDGSSAAYDLQLLLGYRWAAEMEEALGEKALAPVYRQHEERLRRMVRERYWDEKRGLYANTPDHGTFSQHANALAVLAEVPSGTQSKQVMEKTVSEPGLAQASIYFRYYLHRALVKAGLGDRYLEMLDTWRSLLKQGVTTWPEVERAENRSECHAWGASPNVELFRVVLGVDSAAPGFQRVVIRPHLGALQHASGSMPHPNGELSVALRRENGRLKAEVVLPPGVEGEFHWAGEKRALSSGRSTLEF